MVLCLQPLPEQASPPLRSWVTAARTHGLATTRTKCKRPQGVHCGGSKTRHAGRESVYKPIKALDPSQVPAASAPTAFLSEVT